MTPVRYWRVGFRSNIQYSYAQLGFSQIALFDINKVDLTIGLLAAAITTNATVIAGYPITNLVDGITTTDYVFNYPTYNSTLTTLNYVQFDFGTGVTVLPDFAAVTVKSTVYNANTVMDCTSLDFYIWSSTDNITWYLQSLAHRPILSVNTIHKLAASTVSSIYPVPSRSMLGGAGGIYGIVSEDGVALPDRPVFLLDRDTMARIGYTTTDQYGGYAFNGLNELKTYMVLATDPSGPPYKNAIVWDRITPINTKGNLQPAQAFWARRARHPRLGGVFSCLNYLSGGTYKWIGGNVLGSERHYNSHAIQQGFDFTQTTGNVTAGGALKYLTSNRSVADPLYGICLWDSDGVASATNLPGQPENYSQLTFEYIFKAPASTETGLIIVHGGTRDSDDYSQQSGISHAYRGMGPTLEVTPVGVINVRFPLSVRNRSVVRCTYSIVPGSFHHVMVVYKEDTDIELYVDGVSVQKTLIPGAGRLFGYGIHQTKDGNKDFEDWDYNSASSNANLGYIRRITSLLIGGYGRNPGTDNHQLSYPPAWGGAVAFVGKYYSCFTAAEVASFYDSLINWDTHVVPSTQSGYMAQVEADSPSFYSRLNDLSAPAKVPVTLGACDYYGTYEIGAQYGGLGFVSGSTSVYTVNGGAILRGVNIGTVFTLELFCRPTSVAGTQRLIFTRRHVGASPMGLWCLNGVVYLTLCDTTGQYSDISFGYALVANQAYHIAVTYDPWNTKTCALYVNGVLHVEKPATVLPDVYANTYSVSPYTGETFSPYLGIGCNPSGAILPVISERFAGGLGELAIYQYVLPAARIAAHYAARNA